MNRSYRKISLILILIFTLSLGNILVFAEGTFTDVKPTHWAYDYIEKVVDLGLMDGYEDGTFRPNEEINTLDALVYITRLLKVNEEEMERAREKYSILLDRFELSEERKDGLAIALEKGLITELLVENSLFVNGQIKKASKVEICIYLVRAMGMEEEAKEETPIFFYKDAESIPTKARPYVKFLIKKGILNEMGDEKGNFNPNENIIRSVLAKMLYETYTLIDGRPGTVPEEPAEDVDEGVYDELVGIVVAKIGDFLLVNRGGDILSYSLSEGIEVTIDGERASIEDLKEGMNIRAKVSEGKVLISIRVEGANDTVYGIIKEVSLRTPASMVVDLADEEGTRTLSLSNKTRVYIDGKESYLFSLREGDLVEVEALDNLALIIRAESKEGKLSGILKDKIFDEEYLLLVEREDGTSFKYPLMENVVVNRNSSRVTVDDLRRGDKLTLFLTYGRVTAIDAESTKGEDEGLIKAILISDEPMLTITNREGDTKTYYISKDASIIIEEEVNNIYGLRLGFLANLKLESDEIVAIEVADKKGSNEFIGLIEYINPEGRFIILKDDSSLPTRNINVSPNASIKDPEGRTLNLKDLSIGNKLLIIGNRSTGQFVADRIVVID